MNEVWNLDRMYTGFDDPKYLADFDSFQKKVAEFIAFTQELESMEPLAGLRKGIALKEELDVVSDTLGAYPRLRAATNAKDVDAISQSGQLMSVYSNMAGANTVFRKWICSIPNLMELVKQDEFLADYTFLFQGMLDNQQYALSPGATQVSAKLNMSGSSAWSKLQGELTSTVPVHYRGTVTNLSTIRNLAYDADPQVRKDAYEAELACYETIKEPVAHALNAIKLATISDCQLRGYESPLARTLKGADMERATLDAMLSAMDEYSPKFWKYLKAKAKALGHENGLPWYDLFAPMGNSSTSFTTEEARDFLLQQFATFDQELTDMVRTAFDDAWIDFYPRDGKRGGAFCSSIHAIGESRILTNYDGMFTDVVTLAHELGHAFHNRCIHSHRVLNLDYSMPVW